MPNFSIKKMSNEHGKAASKNTSLVSTIAAFFDRKYRYQNYQTNSPTDRNPVLSGNAIKCEVQLSGSPCNKSN